VVAVRQALGLEEEIVGFLLVELGARVSRERVVGDVEASVLGKLEPVSPLGALEAVSGPVPSVLGLDNVELAIEAEGHDVMTDASARAVHDHRVETVEAHDTKEITRVDSFRVQNNLLNGTLLKLNTNGFLEPFNVSLFHVGRHMRADVGQAGVVRNASDESLKRGPQRLDVLNHILAESEGLDAAVANISLRLGRVHLESQLVGAVEVEDLEVLDLSVREEDDILAHLALGVCCRDVHVESCFADLLVLEGNLLEAAALVGHLGVRLTDLSSKDWEEHT